MKINEAKDLIALNWRLYSGISFSLGKKGVRISRLFIIIPALFGLVVAAYLVNNLTALFVIFLMSLFLLEMAKIAHKAGIDPIHLFDLDINYHQKIRNILLAELLGVKFISLFLFGMVAWIGAYDLIALPILILLYGIFNVLFVLMWIIGNRIRIAS